MKPDPSENLDALCLPYIEIMTVASIGIICASLFSQETSRKLNIAQILEQWMEDVDHAHNFHLDIRTRWILPEGYKFPNSFCAPSGGVTQTSQAANSVPSM